LEVEPVTFDSLFSQSHLPMFADGASDPARVVDRFEEFMVEAERNGTLASQLKQDRYLGNTPSSSLPTTAYRTAATTGTETRRHHDPADRLGLRRRWPGEGCQRRRRGAVLEGARKERDRKATISGGAPDALVASAGRSDEQGALAETAEHDSARRAALFAFRLFAPPAVPDTCCLPRPTTSAVATTSDHVGTGGNVAGPPALRWRIAAAARAAAVAASGKSARLNCLGVPFSLSDSMIDLAAGFALLLLLTRTAASSPAADRVHPVTRLADLIVYTYFRREVLPAWPGPRPRRRTSSARA
ncbi:hypothetical protein HK405_014199, partial [Cladochytrium tenue]